MGFVANFMCFPAVQKFKKSVKISESYREFRWELFFRHSVETENS